MKCRYAVDKSLERNYSKKLWKQFRYKPEFTYCNKYKCVCNARLENDMWKCEFTEFLIDLYDRLWEYNSITFTKLLKLKKDLEYENSISNTKSKI